MQILLKSPFTDLGEPSFVSSEMLAIRTHSHPLIDCRMRYQISRLMTLELFTILFLKSFSSNSASNEYHLRFEIIEIIWNIIKTNNRDDASLEILVAKVRVSSRYLRALGVKWVNASKGIFSNTPVKLIYIIPLSRGGRKCGHVRWSAAQSLIENWCWKPPFYNNIGIVIDPITIVMEASDGISKSCLICE